MDIASTLEQRLAGGELNLPPLPEVAQRILALSNDEHASSSTLAQLVHRDAGLAAAVLRSANSASLAGVTRIVSLQQAVARLGMTEVSRIAFTTSMREGIFASGSYSKVIESVWRRSLATGLFAKEIARTLRLNVETAFLCGLLWRVGQPLALNGLPQVCSKEQLPSEADALTLSQRLDENFTVAVSLLWELPEAVGGTLRSREQTQTRSTDGHIACLAERLADIALAEKDEGEPVEVPPDAASVALNLYPEQLESLMSHAEFVRAEIASSP